MSQTEEALRLSHGEKVSGTIFFGVLCTCFLAGLGLSADEALRHGLNYGILGAGHQDALTPVWQVMMWMLLAMVSSAYSIHCVWRLGRLPMGRRIV